MDEKKDLVDHQKPCKNDEAETRKLFYSWLFRAALWLVWFIGLIVWLNKEPGLFFGLGIGMLFSTILFDPFFYYLLLGGVLWVYASMAFGKSPEKPSAPNPPQIIFKVSLI